MLAAAIHPEDSNNPWGRIRTCCASLDAPGLQSGASPMRRPTVIETIGMAGFEPTTSRIRSERASQTAPHPVLGSLVVSVRARVGMAGFEPTSSCIPSRRASRLRHIPINAFDTEGTDSVVFATSTRGAGHQPWAGYGRLDSTCWSPAVTRFSTRWFRFRASTFMTTTPNGVSLMYLHSRHRASEHARIHRVSVNTASILYFGPAWPSTLEYRHTRSTVKLREAYSACALTHSPTACTSTR